MLRDREKVVDLGWLLICGTFAMVWCWSAGHALGPTFDEPFYMRAGLTNWHNLNHRELLCAGTMPLPPEVQMLPLRLAEVFASADPLAAWRDWLPLARMGTILFVWTLLWGAMRLGAIYGGAWGGRLAVTLVACEPILLGHGSLATTDVAFAACLTALIAVFRGRRDAPTWCGRCLLPGLWVALTFLAKASALVYVPICLTMVEAERLWSNGWRPWRRPEDGTSRWTPALLAWRDLSIVGLLGVAFLFMLCPRAWRGINFQISHNLDGHGTVYLFGQTSTTGFWYYFPAALAIKLALPVFALLAVMLILRPRYLLNGSLLAAAAMLLMTPSFRVQIGVRFVLPIAALAIIGVSAACARWFAEQAGARRALMGGFAALCVAWSLGSAVLVWPNGICYTNEIFGGTSQGYRSLTESNVDWGQGLNELADWEHAHDDAPLRLWYFGVDPVCMNEPFHPVLLHSIEADEVRRLCGGGYLAVSVTHLCANFHDAPAARYLRTLQPCAQTSAYLIYDLRSVPPR
ncbi:MAG TPA: hypothetical protein VFE62_22355 [Gemmataceae bacterium]|nr:hypothetical protein [Gemmataceae bacterium]